MPTNFKYVPLSPEPISGRAVLEQTERAINELGDAMEAGVDAATTLAQEAVDTANSANTTANSALIEAQDASTAAQSAQSTADTAFSIAQAAQSDASTALTTANQALDAAAIAEGDSSTALTTANQALTTANAAQETATTADQNASTSLTVSNNALAVSVVSMGIFTVLSDAIDANQYYVSAEKYFLTNSSCTNFPTDMTFPAWFMVYINSDGTSVTHTCWDDTDTARIYTRTATINNSDPENPVVTWSPWQSVATPNNLESVDVQVDPPGQPSGTYLVFVYSTTSGTDTLYVNLSQLMPVYTSGNGAIDISTDYRVSLRIDPSSMGASVSDSGLKITGQTGTVIYGEIRLLPFRPADLVTAAPGWYFCNGDNYALSSAQGTALNALSANFKSDWGVTISGSNISLPNLFYSDGRGLFLRSVNGSTRQVGSVEDDQMRPITGEAGDGSSYGLFSLTAATGAFKVIASGNHTPNGSVFPSFRLGLDSSLLGTNYNGADTHPLNTGMTPAIFLGV